MEKWQVNLLRQHKPALVKQIDQVADLLDQMEAECILADSTIEKIRDLPNRKDQVRDIIESLKRRPPEVFSKFCTCLVRSNNYHCAKLLDPDVKNEQGQISSRPMYQPHDDLERVCKRMEQPTPSSSSDKLKDEQYSPTSSSDVSPTSDASDELPSEWPDLHQTNDEIFVNPVSLPHIKELYISQQGIYHMKSSPRGRAVILSISKIPQRTSIMNHTVDVDGLHILLKGLDYEVVHWENLSSEDLFLKLNEEKNHDHSFFDSFMMFIITHGNEQGLIFADGEIVKVKDIVYQFSRDQSPTLIAKPKMFFVQACQGTQIDHGLDADATDADPIPGDIFDVLKETDALKRDVGIDQDLLIANAATPGFASFKARTGTWFIQAVIYVFSRLSHKYHVNDLMIKVNELMSRGRTAKKNFKQTSSVYGTLTKSVYLFPGMPGDV